MADSAARIYRRTDVADAHLLRSLDVAALEAEAAIRRDENVAADDLALSLRQGTILVETLRRWGSFEVSTGGGGFFGCSELGLDYVVLGDVLTLLPLRRVAAARASRGPSVPHRERDLASLLRSAARRGVVVEVDLRGEDPLCMRGLLLQASPDHVVLRGPAGEIAVGLNGVGAVRVLGDGGLPGGGGR